MPTYQELENNNAELQKQNKNLLINISTQNDENEKCATELIVANIELEHQNKEKEKRAAELNIANTDLLLQNKEKEKRATELIISKIKFAQQCEKNQNLAEELIIANLAVALQSELIVAKEKAEGKEIQLRELNATKDKLFSIIAHDLLNPIGNILSLSELLTESVKNNEVEETDEFISFIKLSATGTLVLLNNLLNWTKSQTGQMKSNSEKLDLSSIIQEVLDIFIPNMKVKNISLSYIQSEDIEVYTDENMLKTVLRNLISNAFKFTAPEGKIKVFAILKHNHVEISISDNGVGINDETLKTLFNVSANIASIGTAHERGSGLGLILCKEFVKKLGGKLWVESEKGLGSNFKFTLPLTKLKIKKNQKSQLNTR